MLSNKFNKIEPTLLTIFILSILFSMPPVFADDTCILCPPGQTESKLYAGTSKNGRIYVFYSSSWALSYDSDETYIASMGTFNGVLYAGSATSAQILKFDGTTWQLKKDTNQTYVETFCPFNGAFYAGADPAINIYKTTSGNTWSNVQTLDEAYALSSAVYNNKLYLGTGYNGKIFVFDGLSWSLSQDTSEIWIMSLEVYNGKLYATTGDNGRVYSFDGTTWSLVQDFPPEIISVESSEVYNGKLYVGTYPTGDVYSFDGTTWSLSLDSSEDNVGALKTFKGKLYAGSTGSGRIYVFDGTTWSLSADTPERKIHSFAVSCEAPSTTTTTTTSTTTTTTTTTLPPTTTTTIPTCGFLKIFKFYDPNGNGIWESGEIGLPGFEFEIFGNGGEFNLTTTTGGIAVTDCIPVGVYLVTEFVPDGWELTTPETKYVFVFPNKLSEVRFGDKQTPSTTTTTLPPSTTTTTAPPFCPDKRPPRIFNVEDSGDFVDSQMENYKLCADVTDDCGVDKVQFAYKFVCFPWSGWFEPNFQLLDTYCYNIDRNIIVNNASRVLVWKIRAEDSFGREKLIPAIIGGKITDDDSFGPTFKNFDYTGKSNGKITFDQNIVVQGNIEDETGIDSVVLYFDYNSDGAEDGAVAPSSISGSFYEFVIPAPGLGFKDEFMKFWIVATDADSDREDDSMTSQFNSRRIFVDPPDYEGTFGDYLYIESFSPAETQFVMKEATAVSFFVKTSTTANYEWKLDGRLVSISEKYTYESQNGDVGLHNVTVAVNNGEQSDTVAWDIAVVDEKCAYELEQETQKQSTLFERVIEFFKSLLRL